MPVSSRIAGVTFGGTTRGELTATAIQSGGTVVAGRERRRPRASMAKADVRTYVARELHDRVAQTLTTMLVELDEFRVGQDGRRSVLGEIDALQASIRQVLDSLRELLHDLRGEPRLVSEAFTEVVARLLAEFEKQTGIEAQLTVAPGWPARVKASAAVNLVRIIGEALANVRRHSGATHVTVTMAPDGNSDVSISVTDDGQGFTPMGVGQLGMGIVGMRERAVLLGARLQISSHDDTGTTIRVIVSGRALSDSCRSL